LSELKEFIEANPAFYRQNGMDKILTIAWYLEAKAKRQSFGSAYMRTCFREIGDDPPNISMYLQRLSDKKPPQLILQGQAYRLSGEMRRKLDRKYGEDVTVAKVASTLAELPAKVPEIAEREFLTEALNCYKVKAYRAAIVMTWNLAFDHLTQWVLADQTKLDAFNVAASGKFNNNNNKKPIVSQPDHFDEFKEFEIIQCIRIARLVDKNTCKILEEKLARRNMAAHPSRIVVTQHQADDAITDLVNNVILPLS
jgi:hypothetical protein